MKPPDSGTPPTGGNGHEPPPPPQAEVTPAVPPTPPAGELSARPPFGFPDRRKQPRLEGETKRRRWYWWVLGGAALFAIIVALTATYPGTSQAFCGSCHTAEVAAELHTESIHAEVSCLGCHGRTHGILGGLAYVPTLLRETAQQLTGLSVAAGVLQPAPCTRCHAEVDEESAFVAAGHPGPDADCSTCHGSVAHPGRSEEPARTDNPHPLDYTFSHGRDVMDATCAECHDSDFCSACHVGTTYPHPSDWNGVHGAAATGPDAQNCASCHGPTFCAGCHGTEIPHPDGWFGFHQRAVSPDEATACTTCHEQRPCESCHVRHRLHIEQNLYDFGVEP